MTINLSTPKLNAAWITWEVQPRNRSMAAKLNVPLFELVVSKSRWVKYPVLIAKTVKILVAHKINVLFVQNPSIVLSFFAVIFSKLTRVPVIVDAHNAGIYPLEGTNKFLNLLAKIIARNATITIVSNSYLAEVVQAWGGRPFILSDPIPTIERSTASIKTTRPYVFFICTWAADEPFSEVIKSAELIDQGVDIYITGNFRKKLHQNDIECLSPNVKLLGFVSEEEYVHYLSQANVAIDLTTRDNCLVCGAYEALALQIPCILSRSKVNEEVFNKGFMFCENTSLSIANTIDNFFNSQKSVEVEIKQFKTDYEAKLNDKIIELLDLVNGLSNVTKNQT